MIKSIILSRFNPMNKFFVLALIAGITFLTHSPLAAQSQSGTESIDQIVAVVNDHVILKSEVDDRTRQYVYQMQQQSNQQIQFDKQMWYTVLQNMVNNYVLLDQAKVDSVTVSDTRVDQQINQQIERTVQQLGSEQALEERMGKSIIQIRADLREQYRQDLIVQKYQQQRRLEIQITRPEVEAFFNSIPKDSLPTIPEQVALSQIVAIPPPNENARKEAFQLAKQLRDSLVNHGKSIEALARKYSDGPSASKGGKIPMYPLDQLAPEYSAAAAALEPGEISEVVETDFGFHIIRLNKRQGEQIDTNHILISIDEDNYNNEAAIKKLNQIRDSLQTHEDASFAEVARNKSEDPNTAPQGGRILNPQTGERLIPIEQLDPALYRIVLLLEEGKISEPKPFTVGTGNNTKRAYRIVKMDNHIPEHTANLKDDYQAIKQRALQQKQYRLMQKWISELKENVYIEYKIPVPKGFKQYGSADI